MGRKNSESSQEHEHDDCDSCEEVFELFYLGSNWRTSWIKNQGINFSCWKSSSYCSQWSLDSKKSSWQTTWSLTHQNWS